MDKIELQNPASAAVFSYDTKARTITGKATVYGQRGNTGAGPCLIQAGALELPTDLSRVKLLVNHDPADAVGYAVTASDSAESLEMTFKLGHSARADEILTAARDGVLDGLSVGLAIQDNGAVKRGGVIEVEAARVYEVSICALPAFENARITDVKATRKEETMTTPTPTQPVVDETEDKTEVATITAAATTTATPAPAASIDSIEAAAARVFEVIRTGGSAADITAALADITVDADKAPGILRPDWLGKLWDGATTRRPLIDSITKRPLNSVKVQGWQWETKPTVDRYAGKKTAIPTSTATTKLLEASAESFAAGWDIERMYIDLGGPSIISELWNAAVEDYRLKTEAYVQEMLLGAATAATKPSTATVPGAIVSVSSEFNKAGYNLSFMAISPDLWEEVSKIKRDDLPWWLTNGALNLTAQTGSTGAGVSFFVAHNLPGKTILVGDKRAAQWHEIKQPVKVQALDLPRGGVDLALHGYGAVLVTNPKALLKVTLGAAG